MLDPLVLGLVEPGDLQDGQLARDRVELEVVGEQRATEAQVRPEGALRVGEHPEDVQRRQALEHLAVALGQVGRLGIRNAGDGAGGYAFSSRRVPADRSTNG